MKYLIPLLIIAAAAHAEVYKCDDGQGNVVYSEAPCGAHAEELSIQSAPRDAINPAIIKRNDVNC